MLLIVDRQVLVGMDHRCAFAAMKSSFSVDLIVVMEFHVTVCKTFVTDITWQISLIVIEQNLTLFFFIVDCLGALFGIVLMFLVFRPG